MRKIVAAIKKQEAGVAFKQICRELGISGATWYNWKAKYGGMLTSDIAKMRDLEKENSELKKRLAGMSIESRALKNLIEKKLSRPRRKREANSLKENFPVL